MNTLPSCAVSLCMIALRPHNFLARVQTASGRASMEAAGMAATNVLRSLSRSALLVDLRSALGLHTVVSAAALAGPTLCSFCFVPSPRSVTVRERRT